MVKYERLVERFCQKTRTEEKEQRNGNIIL